MKNRRASVPSVLAFLVLSFLLAACSTSLANRTPEGATLPPPTRDDPAAADPGVTGVVGGPSASRPEPVSPWALGDPDGPGTSMPSQPPLRDVPAVRPIPSPQPTTPPQPISPPRPASPRPASPRPEEWPPGGVTSGVPPIPPPPEWDPSQDTRVSEPDARALARPGRAGAVPVEPARGPRDTPVPPPAEPVRPTEPTPPSPDRPVAPAPSPWRPGPQPRAGTVPAIPPPAAPATSTDDLGAPPGGPGASPWPGDSSPPPEAPPSVPSRPVDPTPGQPAPRQPTPAPGVDPWLPGAGLPPGDPRPVDPRPVDPRPVEPRPADPRPPTPPLDPWLPGAPDGAPTPAPTQPLPTQAAGTDLPPLDPPANLPRELRPDKPTLPQIDPWLPGAAPGGSPDAATPDAAGPDGIPLEEGPAFVSDEAARRAMEQVTRLLDRPGSRDVEGYPAAVVTRDDPGMALTPGSRPVLLVFYDDASRESDLQAARLLPLVVRLRDEIDFVAVDSAQGAASSRGTEELATRYLERVPTVVVLDAARKTRLFRSGAVDAQVVEAALEEARRLPSADPDLPALPGAPDPDGPPAGTTPAGPFGDAPRPGPGPADDVPSAPGRSEPTFSAPSSQQAEAHALRLRSAPGDEAVPGYPSSLLRSASADIVLSAGVKPCVILFYDDASKASDLQAAAFLPLLVQRKADVDLVLIDVGTKARWSPDEKKVVRTYYNFYVPTTVVLAPNRAPIRSWYSRVEPQALGAAIDQAFGR